MRVEQVDFLSVPTRGIARATAWYRDVLGPAPSEHDSEEMGAPNVTRSFWNPLGDSEPFEPNTSGIAFRVDDVESAVGEARAAGAEVIGVEGTGVCRMGSVKDPDGNVVTLHGRYRSRDHQAAS